MTLKLNTTEFTNKDSVGVIVLKRMLELEREHKHVNFNTLLKSFDGKFSRASLHDCIHTLAQDLIIEGTFTNVLESKNETAYCFSIYPQYVPTIAQWIEGNYVSLEDFV